jgi:hypothetical protein
MDSSREIKELQRIKDMYFRPVIARPEGYLTHYGDCSIHRAIVMYDYAPCTCGFNYWLRPLTGGLASKLNPDWDLDYRRQECGVKFKMSSPQELDEMCRALQEALGPFRPQTKEEEQLQNEVEWLLILEVFGNEYCEYLKTLVPDVECGECGLEFSSQLHPSCCPWCYEIGAK